MANRNRRLTAQQATYQLPAVLVQPLTGRRIKKRAMKSYDSMALFKTSTYRFLLNGHKTITQQ